MMRLFADKVRTGSDSKSHAETSFAYFDRSGRRIIAALRELLESWFARYPAEHRAHLRGRLFSKRDPDQQAAWWELYLHESFLRGGYAVAVSSGTPDFTIDGPGGRFHVEATARFDDPANLAQQRRTRALRDALDCTPAGLFRLWVEVYAIGDNAAPSSRFRARILRWLKSLDVASVHQNAGADPSNFERYPHRMFVEDDWRIDVRAVPARTEWTEGTSAIVVWGPGEMVLVQNEEPLRNAISKKARDCRNLDAPLVVAVLHAREYGHEHQLEGGLIGYAPERTYASDRVVDSGERDILWAPSGGDRSVAGVLAGVHLGYFNIAKIGLTLWTNPLIRRQPLPFATELPWQHRWVDEEAKLQASAVPSPAAFFGVASDWPGASD